MKSRFVNVPALDIEGFGIWALTEDCIYRSSIGGRIVVPSGFLTDLASIPRFPGVRFLFPVNNQTRAPAIVHDYLCTLGMDYSRVQADKIFLEAMKVCRVAAWRRWAMYLAVSARTYRMKAMGKAR